MLVLQTHPADTITDLHGHNVAVYCNDIICVATENNHETKAPKAQLQINSKLSRISPWQSFLQIFFTDPETFLQYIFIFIENVPVNVIMSRWYKEVSISYVRQQEKCRERERETVAFKRFLSLHKTNVNIDWMMSLSEKETVLLAQGP